MAAGTVSARVANSLLDFAVGRGVGRERLLAEAGLDGGQLEPSDRRIPFDNYVSLMRAASRLSRDPAFALHFGEVVDIREMSIAALLGQSLDTAMDVFAAVNRYVSLDIEVETEGGLRLELVPKGGKLWLVDRRTDPNAFPELTESAFARMVAAGRRIGLDMPIRELHVTHAEPAHRAEYDRIFQVPIRFGGKWNAFAIESGAMAQPIALQPAYAGRIIEARADALLKEMRDARSMRGAVESILRPLLGQGKGCAATAASALGVSRQTLYRRLKAEGTSFEEVLRTTRLRLARELLAECSLTVDEVGCRLGFADGSSFSKAFKRWTGASPGAARTRKSRGRPAPPPARGDEGG